MNMDDGDYSEWHYTFGEANVGVKFEGAVNGFVIAKVHGGSNIDFVADASVGLGPVILSIGRNELPWAQWSSFNLWGNNNWAFGASSSNRDNYLQVKYAADALSIYGGLAEAGVHGGIVKDRYVFPGFYAGGDFTQEGVFSAGAAFAGVPRGEAYTLGGIASGDSVFAWMGNIHGKIFLSPITIGINAAIYSAPTFGFFALDAGNLVTTIGNKDDMVLEAMLDVGIAGDALPCDIGLTGALLMGLQEDTKGGKGMALQIGASFTFNIEGFQIIPGIIYTNQLNEPGDVDLQDYAHLGIGVSFNYSF